MKRAPFSVGILLADVAKSLRDCVAEIQRAEAAYDTYAKSSDDERDYSAAATARLDALDREVGLSRARLQGCVQALLARDEETKRHA